MKTRRAFGGVVAVASVAAACGRTDLNAGDTYPTAVAGRGGTSSSAGGSGARAGGPSGGGGRVGTAGAGGRGMAGSAGVAGAPPACASDPVEVEKVSPTNGAPSQRGRDWALAQFRCSLAPELIQAKNVKLYGQSSGYVAVDFPARTNPAQLWLDPLPYAGVEAYFAGERVTAWLGEELGGPYLWQFTAAVRQLDVPSWRAHAPVGYDDLGRNSALGDFDRDGDLDVVLEGNGTLALLRNRGDGTFESPDRFGSQGPPVVGDVDRDGYLDVMAAGALWLNLGDGHFTAGVSFGPCTALGDLDGDSDLDCVANDGYDDSTVSGHVALNDGNGRFSPGPKAPFGFECELADLDGDADLDAACVSPVVEAARVFLNDGKGAFTRTEQVLGEVGARGLSLGDLDADGDVDAVVSQWFGAGKSSPNQVWLNDGKGSFRQAGAIGADGGTIALADIDGDGDFDALFSHLTPYGPNNGPFNPIRVYGNDGNAQFVENQATVGDPAFHWFKLGDLDQDGDLDAFIYHQVPVGGNYTAVWLTDR